jgi:hypothetical protein
MPVSSPTKDTPNAVVPTAQPIITRREIVSAPTSIIQVERISISEAHEAAIAAALRAGRQSAKK